MGGEVASGVLGLFSGRVGRIGVLPDLAPGLDVSLVYKPLLGLGSGTGEVRLDGLLFLGMVGGGAPRGKLLDSGVVGEGVPPGKCLDSGVVVVVVVGSGGMVGVVVEAGPE